MEKCMKADPLTDGAHAGEKHIISTRIIPPALTLICRC